MPRCYESSLTFRDLLLILRFYSNDGSFSLTDYDDESVTDADFRDWLALIYFGYAYCPDIYSTNLQVMGTALSGPLAWDTKGTVQKKPSTVSATRVNY